MRVGVTTVGLATVAAVVILWTRSWEDGGGGGAESTPATLRGSDGQAGAPTAGVELPNELEEPARENVAPTAPDEGAGDQPAEEEMPNMPLTGSEADEAVLEELSKWGTDELLAEHKKQHEFLVEVASPVYESFFDAGDYETLVGDQANKAAKAALNTTPYSVRLFNDGTAQRVILRESEFPELFEAKRRMSIAEDVLRSRGVRTSF